ncbi:MAG: flagellar motor switch phosphatase FliY [Ruminococcus sp.]|jgi:flagellar motor switch protein FliN/FliY|nr:flagellar motor switch phosphatase FliY [Ruminococcus sp.]
MDNKKLSSMEIDAIGEILNISLGASATAISTMLDARVDITTPVVQVQKKDEFQFNHLEPAVGVEIVYIEGLTGSNIMILKRNDVRVIVEMLMGMEIAEEDFELDEMNISAICEVMNQMMGASATALSELLGRTVNISTPQSFEVTSADQFKEKYFEDDGMMVVIGFTIQIADKLKSEFINLMPIGLAHELVAGFFSDGVPDIEEESQKTSPVATAVQEQVQADVPQPESSLEQIEKDLSRPKEAAGQVQADISGLQPANGQVQADVFPLQSGEPQSAPVQASSMADQVAPVNVQSSDAIAGMMNLMYQQMQQMQQMQAQMQQVRAPKKIGVNPAPRPNLAASADSQPDQEEQDANMELIMGVPLDVSVEIGRTRKLVKDILDLNKGSLVVLDKLAGEQVDLFVNGQCIAKGDVVVVDDNFGIRITEILKEEISLLE